MTRLVTSVASLTDLRDRDELEIALSSVIFDLVGPLRLSMWRLVSHRGELRLRERARISTGRSVFIPDVPTDPSELPSLNSYHWLRDCYDNKAPVRLGPPENGQHYHVFPLVRGRDVIGLLEINYPTPLREYQERLMAALLRIYRNHLTVLDDAECDELTGLLNRKTFDNYFRQHVSQEDSRRRTKTDPAGSGRRRFNTAQYLWLAVMDIDFFKSINDRFGHLYGDEVLVLLARLLRSLFRDSDRVFRFGGEEFAVIFGPAEPSVAQEILERCRAAVERFDFPQVGPVTISTGYTAIVTGDSGSSAFGRADEALYVAKRRGRNLVLFHQDLIAEGALRTKLPAAGDVELF